MKDSQSSFIRKKNMMKFIFRMAEDHVKVVLNIKQETFDAYVRENIDDLEMDADEAVQDAIGTGLSLNYII